MASSGSVSVDLEPHIRARAEGDDAAGVNKSLNQRSEARVFLFVELCEPMHHHLVVIDIPGLRRGS